MRPHNPRRPLVALQRARILPAWVRRMDERAARTINRHHHVPGIDRGFSRLSQSANRSMLWLGISAALVVTGQQNRRGAVRGVASLVTASIIANLIGKNVFGGDRPLLKDVPIGRRLKKTPTSPSFPSGHSASAAAFVTGVALESPRMGAALAPLAGAVAYSRLHTGAHWLSDVIGGVALGSAVALGGKLLVAAKPSVETAKGPLVQLPARPDGAGVLILVNPASGRRVSTFDPSVELSAKLPRAVIHTLDTVDDMASIVQNALASAHPPRVLGVYGGDGSVSAAAQVARNTGLPLFVLPGGTFNDFAGTAGISSIDTAVDALRSGAGHRADVAELSVGDGSAVTVINEASAGVYPAFVTRREKREKRLGKPIAALIAAAAVLARADPTEVTIDGRASRVWSIFIGVGRNSSSTMIPLQRRRLDDGVLDVRILHVRGTPSRIRAIVAIALGRRASAVLDRLPFWSGEATIETFTTDAVSVGIRNLNGQNSSLAHDGEVFSGSAGGAEPSGDISSTVRIVPGGLNVYSPLANANNIRLGRAAVDQSTASVRSSGLHQA